MREDEIKKDGCEISLCKTGLSTAQPNRWGIIRVLRGYSSGKNRGKPGKTCG
jgi:hypothetical protein